MLIYSSILPVVFLLVHCVFADLNRSKRVPQDLKEVKIPYHLNHPPSVESYIPVSVIYDDVEDIHVIGESIKPDKTETDHISSEDDTETSATQKVAKPKSLYGNHPPTVEEYNPIAVAIEPDHKEESIVKSVIKDEDSNSNQEKISPSLEEITDIKNTSVTESVKPKGRSVNFENNAIRGNSGNRKNTQRQRLHQANKIKVSEQPNKTSNSETKTTTTQNIKKGEILNKTEVTHNNNQSTRDSKYQKRTQQRDPVVPIIDSENYLYAYNGDYHYRYEGGDGTKAFERGELKTVDGGTGGAGVVGGFSYTDKDGNDFSLSYTADENGYRPVGAHLPTPPPIPLAIQRALELLATKTTPEPVTEKVKAY